MPNVVVNDLAHATVDGEHVGAVTDVLANCAGVEGIRGALLSALQAWDAARVAEHGEAIRAMREAHAAELAERQSLIDALGGAELGRKAAVEARRKALLEARAAADAELAELDDEVESSGGQS